MDVGLYSVPLTAFNTQSTGAELSAIDWSDWADWDYYSYINVTLDTNLPSGYTVGVNIDSVIAEALGDYSDIRILYWNGSEWTEIDRDIRDIGEGELCYFALQAALTSASTTDYIVVWGNSSPPPVMNDRDNVYLFHHDCETKANWNDYDAVWTVVAGEFRVGAGWNAQCLNTTDVGADDVVVYGKVRVATIAAGIALRSDAAIDQGWGVHLDPGSNRIWARWFPPGSPTFLGAYVCNLGVDYIIKTKVVDNNFDAWASPRGTPIVGAPLLSWVDATGAGNRNVGFYSANALNSTFDDIYALHAVTNDPTVAMVGKMDVTVPTEITVNAVNKIAVVNRSESRLCPVGTELWYVRADATGQVNKRNQADLSDAGIITLQWTGLNAKYTIYSICVVGGFIYGLVKYKAVTNLKAVGKWDLAGNLIDEFIDYVNPPADGELWTSFDMVSDGSFLYVPQNVLIGGAYYVKKFDLAGNFIAKCAVTPMRPTGNCLGQDGYLYATDANARRTAKISPAAMTLETLVDSYASNAGGGQAHIGAMDDDHVYKLLKGECAVSVQSTDIDHDYRGAFGASGLMNLGEYTVATGRPAGAFRSITRSGLVEYFLYINDISGSPFENVIHKIYVKENRTVQTGTPVIASEGDLKTKTGLVNPSYLRLAVQDDVDGGEITYYRSSDGAAWTEVTRAGGFDLSGHSAGDPLYLKAKLDNLFAKVGSPKVYGVDIIAQGGVEPHLPSGSTLDPELGDPIPQALRRPVATVVLYGDALLKLDLDHEHGDAVRLHGT